MGYHNGGRENHKHTRAHFKNNEIVRGNNGEGYYKAVVGNLENGGREKKESI